MARTSAFMCVHSIFSNSLQASHTSLCTEFSRQEYWSGLSFASPGDLPDWGLNLCFLRLHAGSLPLSHQGSLKNK